MFRVNKGRIRHGKGEFLRGSEGSVIARTINRDYESRQEWSLMM